MSSHAPAPTEIHGISHDPSNGRQSAICGTCGQYIFTVYDPKRGTYDRWRHLPRTKYWGRQR